MATGFMVMLVYLPSNGLAGKLILPRSLATCPLSTFIPHSVGLFSADHLTISKVEYKTVSLEDKVTSTSSIWKGVKQYWLNMVT